MFVINRLLLTGSTINTHANIHYTVHICRELLEFDRACRVCYLTFLTPLSQAFQLVIVTLILPKYQLITVVAGKQQPSNIKHGGGIRPNVWVLTFGPLCIYNMLCYVVQYNYKVLQVILVKTACFSIFATQHYSQIWMHLDKLFMFRNSKLLNFKPLR